MPTRKEEVDELRAQLRHAELRLAGLRRQLEQRLDLIQTLRAELQVVEALRAELQRTGAERDAVSAALAKLRSSRTVRYTEAPRRLYGRLRARLGYDQ